MSACMFLLFFSLGTGSFGVEAFLAIGALELPFVLYCFGAKSNRHRNLGGKIQRREQKQAAEAGGNLLPTVIFTNGKAKTLERGTEFL